MWKKYAFKDNRRSIKTDKGSVKVYGSIKPLIELGVGFDHDLTAEENIYLNGAILGYGRQEMQKHYEDIVEFSELRDFMNVPIKNFSSGMLARLAFSITTIGNPDLLIVDEVLSVGDFRFQEKCERRIQNMMKEDTSILFVSHSIEQVQKLCKRAIWIEKGHIGGSRNNRRGMSGIQRGISSITEKQS